MNWIKQHKLLLLLLFVLTIIASSILFPFIEAIAEFPVEVTWTMISPNTQCHTISFDGTNFMIKADENIITKHKLMGGFNGTIFWMRRGWGLTHPIFVDEKEIDTSMLSLSSSGNVVFCGLSSKPRLKINITIKPEQAPAGDSCLAPEE